MRMPAGIPLVPAEPDPRQKLSAQESSLQMASSTSRSTHSRLRSSSGSRIGARRRDVGVGGGPVCTLHCEPVAIMSSTRAWMDFVLSGLLNWLVTWRRNRFVSATSDARSGSSSSASRGDADSGAANGESPSRACTESSSIAGSWSSTSSSGNGGRLGLSDMAGDEGRYAGGGTVPRPSSHKVCLFILCTRLSMLDGG